VESLLNDSSTLIDTETKAAAGQDSAQTPADIVVVNVDDDDNAAQPTEKMSTPAATPKSAKNTPVVDVDEDGDVKAKGKVATPGTTPKTAKANPLAKFLVKDVTSGQAPPKVTNSRKKLSEAKVVKSSQKVVVDNDYDIQIIDSKEAELSKEKEEAADQQQENTDPKVIFQ